MTCKTVYDTKCKEKSAGYTKKEECAKWPREECTVAYVKIKKTIPDSRCKKIQTRICV